MRVQQRRRGIRWKRPWFDGIGQSSNQMQRLRPRSFLTLSARDLTEREGEIEVLERHPHRAWPPSVPQDSSHPGAFGQAIRRDQPDHATVAQRRLRSPFLIVAGGGINAFGRSGPGIGEA
jgi:hypothetical protein